MIYGLYLSGQGAEVQSARLETVANNLANAKTTAFKRDLALFQAHHPFDVANGIPNEPPGEVNQHTGGVTLAGMATDFSDGAPEQTGGSLDVALHGAGFLQVGDGEQPFLTRDGRLAIDEQRVLVMSGTDLPVLDQNGGTIKIPSEATNVQIADDGTIRGLIPGADEASFGRLALVVPESFESLQKLGESLYRPLGAVRAAEEGEIQVRQGFLEQSGVNPIHEMMEMIKASRVFEANVNMAKFQDSSLGRLIGAMGRR
jgi:flagellar basal body rod protein FlgG